MYLRRQVEIDSFIEKHNGSHIEGKEPSTGTSKTLSQSEDANQGILNSIQKDERFAPTVESNTSPFEIPLEIALTESQLDVLQAFHINLYNKSGQSKALWRFFSASVCCFLLHTIKLY